MPEQRDLEAQVRDAIRNRVVLDRCNECRKVSGVEHAHRTRLVSNSTAVSFVLQRRYQIDPFYTLILVSDDRIRLDRWIQMQPEQVL